MTSFKLKVYFLLNKMYQTYFIVSSGETILKVEYMELIFTEFKDLYTTDHNL